MNFIVLKKFFSSFRLLWSRNLTGTARRYPNFLCIGAQRSGTTWLYENLNRHPDIYLTPCKEVHYLDQRFGPEPHRWHPSRIGCLKNRQAARQGRKAEKWFHLFADSQTVDDAWYAKIFSFAPQSAVLGDITPAYAILPDMGVSHAARLMPEANIIYILRNPVERMVSGAWHELMLGRKGDDLPTWGEFKTELQGERCRSRSRYSQTIKIWQQYFPPQRLLIIFHDDIVSRPHYVLQKVCDHLKVSYDPSFFPSVDTKINSNKAIPAEYLEPARQLARESCEGEIARLSELVKSIPEKWAK